MEKETGEISGHPRTKLDNHNQICSISWFSACLQETLLPGKPWHKVLERLETAFADEIKDKIRDPKQRKLVFNLLGQSFVKRYFSDCPVQPDSLSSTAISEINDTKLEEATRVWLQNQSLKAAESIHCHFHSGAEAASLAPEMVHFLDDVYSVVIAKMELLLATCGACHKAHLEGSAQGGEALCKLPQSSRDSGETSVVLQRPKSIESKDICLVLSERPASQVNGNGEDLQLHIRPELHPPVLSCPESDLLGDLLCAIVSRGSENMSAACESLSGKLLPRTLRQFIWIDKLLRASSGSPQTKELMATERDAREDFGQTVAWRMAELNLRSATRSPLSGLIENAVVEKYRSVPCMRPFATNEQVILETSKSLNVLYVFNGTYDPYLIYWLFPLQMAFKQTAPRAEHPYELAMYLHSLHQNLFPTWGELFVTAESVMSLLEREDAEFFAHLHRAFRKNVTVDPKDFLVDLILQERGRAQGICAFEDGFPSRQNGTKEILASPMVFLRKWMGEGFVGVLNLPAVLLIWDQLFMKDWNLDVMQNFCVSVLLLLKDSFMAADDYPAVRQVFLSSASQLLTADIQRAWIHLQQGGLPADVPGLNRLNQRPLVDLSPPRHGSAEAGKMCLDPGEISPTGVKDILLTVVLPVPRAETRHSESLFKKFDPSAVKLTVSVFCGPEMLRSKTSSFISSLLRKTQGKTEMGFTLQFSESFAFDSLDPTAFVGVQDAKPYILLKVTYSPKGTDSLALGWQKVDVFQQETTGSGMIWAPREFSPCVPLNPGEVPDAIMECPFRELPKDFAEGHSTIQLTVYDVANERRRLQSHRLREERLQGPSFLYAPWVPHDPSITLPSPPRISQPFDLYIDALHYIPDNATITKVTGHFRNTGFSNLHPFVAFPVLESPSRNPEFQYRAAIDGGISSGMDINTWLLFQVHTVDMDSGDLVLLGSCAIHIFNAEGELNVGGFQLKLRAGLLEDGPSPLTPSSLDRHTVIPCCTLLIRLLPHAQVPVPPPSYLAGYYFTDGAKPNSSELEIISSFQKDSGFPNLVLDMALQLTNKEQSRVLPDQLKAWCVEKLSERGHLSPRHPLKCIDIHRAVRYWQEAGVRVRIKQAFGLKADGCYVNALARILKGAASTQLPELPQRWGGEETFLVQQLDFSSLQRSPKWIDPSVVLHPYLDDHSVLLIQIYGLDAIYTPDPSGQRPGTVAPRSGQAIELNEQSQLGWTVLPLFDRNCVGSGVHNTPLFQGVPSPEFLQGITTRPVKDVMSEGLQKKRLRLLATYGSLVTEVWDGHYFDDERQELPVLNDLLSVDKTRKFLAARASKRGKEMSQLVLKILDKKTKKLGCTSLEYLQQEDFYKQTMGAVFYNVVETALMNAGYGPL
uniref:uncharacterized protein LOC114585224 isoform X1 n=3 Tax=Podarcis muralis TaxID=64176 RepID=UPI0010A06226|nr:uncharacterized protein LOC114585224 isoform X1 [Podarcis muralis]XP_028563493.1 uncharacterized protein LOC114585224 isoform X1 [Podarcis muralis]